MNSFHSANHAHCSCVFINFFRKSTEPTVETAKILLLRNMRNIRWISIDFIGDNDKKSNFIDKRSRWYNYLAADMNWSSESLQTFEICGNDTRMPNINFYLCSTTENFMNSFDMQRTYWNWTWVYVSWREYVYMKYEYMLSHSHSRCQADEMKRIRHLHIWRFDENIPQKLSFRFTFVSMFSSTSSFISIVFAVIDDIVRNGWRHQKRKAVRCHARSAHA